MVGTGVAVLLICERWKVFFLEEVWSAVEAGASEREYGLTGCSGFDG
jgi:hypothetical protein